MWIDFGAGFCYTTLGGDGDGSDLDKLRCGKLVGGLLASEYEFSTDT